MNQFKENVILVDADYVDRVAFGLTVNFERMIGRQIPKADMARWADCVALDGGLRPLNTPSSSSSTFHEVQVVLIHDKQQTAMKNFVPSDFDSELNGQAFKDHLGEFVFESYPVEDEVVSKADFMVDVLQTICSEPAVKRIMMIPNAEDPYIINKVAQVLQRIDDEGLKADEPAVPKRITLFTMQPLSGCQCRQEILGYSLMAALGINADEIPTTT